MARKKWEGDKPICDSCHAENMTRFVDCKTVHGPWAILCRKCYKKIGLPIGQEYVYSFDDEVYYKDQDLRSNHGKSSKVRRLRQARKTWKEDRRHVRLSGVSRAS